MKSLLFISLGALIGGLLSQVVLAWLLLDDAVRGCKPMQTPLVTERDEYE